MPRVVKLLARADRASQAHALTAALQYVSSGMPVLVDGTTAADLGPGADLYREAGGTGFNPHPSPPFFVEVTGVKAAEKRLGSRHLA